MLTFSRQMIINGAKLKVRMPRVKLIDCDYKVLVLWNGKWTKMELEDFGIDERTGEKTYIGSAYPDNFMACQFCSVQVNNPPCAECTLPDEDRTSEYRSSGVPQQYLSNSMTRIQDLRKLGRGGW